MGDPDRVVGAGSDVRSADRRSRAGRQGHQMLSEPRLDLSGTVVIPFRQHEAIGKVARQVSSEDISDMVSATAHELGEALGKNGGVNNAQ